MKGKVLFTSLTFYNDFNLVSKVFFYSIYVPNIFNLALLINNIHIINQKNGH